MLDAVSRVTGALPYAANLSLPGMLWGRVLRSPYPHARILRLDASAAEALPGVAAVVSAADFAAPGLSLSYGHAKDQTVVAEGCVRFIGEPVALVAAETPEIAAAALEAIEVEYEELPAVFDVAEALAPGAPQLHAGFPGNVIAHAKLRHGDLAAGFAAADEIIEETFTSPIAHVVTLEPQVALAHWVDGLLTVWTASQSPYTVRRELAGIFGLDPAAVRVIVPPLGGGFGGKGNVRTQPMAAALAWKASRPHSSATLQKSRPSGAAGRPVKLVLSRAEEFITTTKHAVTIDIKSGVKRDGTLTARQVTLRWNSGAYTSSSVHLVPAGMLRSIGPYHIPAVRVDSYGIATNLPPSAAFRGAMSSQGCWAHESHMDSLARRVGLDPLEFRLKNLLRPGDPFATGETIPGAHFVECLEAAAHNLGWGQPYERQPAPHLRRGRGLGVMMKNTVASSRSECRLELDGTGRVTLYTSAVEMGQGTHTALAQLCAEALGLPLEAIAVQGPDTQRTPYDAQTSASRTSYMMGNAVVEGAEALKRQLRELAAPIFECPPDQLVFEAGRVFAEDDPARRLGFGDVLRLTETAVLEAVGAYETKAGIDRESGQGVASPHWHQGAGACEVEVDVETGQVRVLRYQAAAFAGRVINPNLAGLQNDGNVIFGLGPALMEEMVFDGGQLINANLSDYLIPSIRDIPPELESASLEAGTEIHGLGEMTLPPVAPAIANAVYDAVGVRLRDLPLTAEKVYRALHHDE